MEEKLAKRLLGLSKTLIVIALVSLVGLLKKLDSEQIRRDVVDLDVLATLRDKDPARIARENGTHGAVWAHLQGRHAALEEQRLRVRRELAAWLVEGGLPESELTGLAGKAQEVPLEQKKPFFTEEISTPDEDGTVPEPEGAALVAVDSVARLLAWHSALFAQTAVGVATAVQISQPLGSDGSSDGSIRFVSAELSGEQLRVRLEVVPPPMVQAAVEERELTLPATVQHVAGDSLWNLRFGHLAESERLEKLRPERKEQLLARYGLLSIGDAQSIARRSLGQAFESLSLLGFSFSPARFPFAVLVVGLLTLFAIGITVARARSEQAPVFTGVELESSLDLVLDSRAGRAALWLLLPPLSLFLSLPAIPLTRLETNVLWSGGAGLVLLGGWAVSAAQSVARLPPRVDG